jgi:hypothetical protein
MRKEALAHQAKALYLQAFESVSPLLKRVANK